MIPPGMRAVSVRVNDVVSVAGFVQPGTRVDVLATARAMATTAKLHRAAKRRRHRRRRQPARTHYRRRTERSRDYPAGFARRRAKIALASRKEESSSLAQSARHQKGRHRRDRTSALYLGETPVATEPKPKPQGAAKAPATLARLLRTSGNDPRNKMEEKSLIRQHRNSSRTLIASMHLLVQPRRGPTS